MTKQKILLVTIFIFLCPLLNYADAQVYSIESLDKGKANITLSYKLFSKSLKISYLNDSLFLDDYTGTVGVYVLNKRFLQIVYNVRGGSGSEIRNTALLSVSRNKINASLLITSYESWFSPDKDSLYTSVDVENLYKLKLSMTGENKSNYKIIARVHDEQKSKRNPQSNYSHDNQFTLKFDTSQDIFYSTNLDLSRTFNVRGFKMQAGATQYVKEATPLINLGKDDYYYIKGEWHDKGADDVLFRYSHR